MCELGSLGENRAAQGRQVSRYLCDVVILCVDSEQEETSIKSVDSYLDKLFKRQLQ